LDLQGLVAAVAVMAVAPFIGRLLAGRVPTVALQMLGGILVGPAGLGWLVPAPAIDLFSKIGLGLIFALIGLSIDQRTLRGVAGRLGGLGWVATVGVGLLLAFTLPLGGGLRPIALVVALSSTALSTLLVVLRESGEWGSPLGRLLLSAGTWGQLGPVLAVALLLGSADPLTTVLSGSSGGSARADHADARVGLGHVGGWRFSGNATAVVAVAGGGADGPFGGPGGRYPAGNGVGGVGDAALHR
jgi:Kef-type K+ transport system membrane component KefB